MKILVAGGAGFIGSSFIRYMLRTREDVNVVNFDLLTYAGNLRNLAEISEDSRYHFLRGDIANNDQCTNLLEQHRFDAVVNFAAETHVDRSTCVSAAKLTTASNRCCSKSFVTCSLSAMSPRRKWYRESSEISARFLKLPA